MLIISRARAHIYWNCVDVSKRYAYIPLPTGCADIALATVCANASCCACVYAGAGAGADVGTVLAHCCIMRELDLQFSWRFRGLALALAPKPIAAIVGVRLHT